MPQRRSEAGEGSRVASEPFGRSWMPLESLEIVVEIGIDGTPPGESDV